MSMLMMTNDDTV